VATASALIRGQVRRVSSEVEKAAGRLTKVVGPLNGGRFGDDTRISTGRIGTPVFRPGPVSRVPPFTPIVPPQPRAPLPPTLPPVQPFAPFAPGPLAPALCDLIPDDTLRALCKAGAGAIFPPGTPRPAGDGLVGGPEGCPAGTIRFQNTCIAAGDLFPGGDPLTFPVPGGAPGTAVQGGFGLPATEPAGVSRLTRKCPRGMVLGIDNLCYAKAILPPRSKLRKWRRPPRPPLSRRDVKAIRTAAAAKDRVFELAKDVGLHVAKSPHRRKK